MSVKFETLKAGDLLYDCRYELAGNTTMKRWGVWTIRVVFVDHEKLSAQVSWNGNPARTEWPRYFTKANISRKERPDPAIARREHEGRRRQ